MRYLVTTLLALISSPTWANGTDSLLQKVQVLGAPMAAVERAIRMEKRMDPTQEPPSLKAFRRTWTWCHWARLKPLILR
jgi:hypothetical protein